MATQSSHLSGVWSLATDLQVVRGHGSWIVDINGNEYLDFTSSIATASTGHAHPRVVQAICDQAGKLVHAQANVYTHDLLEATAAKLAEITPESIDTFFFSSSNDEAVESAVKLAKHATGRHNVVAFDGAFHGRTHLTLAMSTARALDRSGYGPFPPGVFIAPFPDPHTSDQETEISRALRGLDRIFSTQVDPHAVACLVIEPVIGERGFIPAPKPFLEGLAKRCKEHGILFVADEVQSGFGRTGKMFAIEETDVIPDVMCMAKGIASGFPFAAIGTRREIDDKWVKGSHRGSYNGNPLGCAATIATIEVLQSPGFLENVSKRGRQLIDGLRDLQQVDTSMHHVRGRGLMIATEFQDAERAAAIVEHCLRENNLLLLTAGTRNRTIRWMPPLTVTKDEVSKALNAFESAIRSVN